MTDKEATEVWRGDSPDQVADAGIRALLESLANAGALPDGMLLVLVGDDDCDVRLSVLEKDPEKACAVLERMKLAVDATLGEMTSSAEVT
jgi:hypothetical protein